MMKATNYAFVAMLIAVSALNLPTAVAAQSACQSDVEPFRQFDFWIGEWSDFSSEGEPTGQTNVTLEGRGCVLLEQWTSIGGSTGVATMYFDQATQSWKRIWRSAGHHIELSGEQVRDGQIVMIGTARHLASQATFPIRGTWVRNDDGSVTVSLDQYDYGQGAWSAWSQLVHVPN